MIGRSRRRIALLAAVVLGVVTVLAVAGMEGTFTYSETPTQLAAHPDGPQQSLRLSGLVVPGSIHRHGAHVRFELTDGAHDVTVRSSAAPPSTFRAGQGAVVEGVMSSPGVFDAQRVLVRHSNQYGPAGATTRAQE